MDGDNGAMPPRRKYRDEVRREALRLTLDEGWTAAAAGEHLGVAPRTLAGWARAEFLVRKGRQWVERVEPHFGFLREHGFGEAEVDVDPVWWTDAIYKSAVGAVVVTCDVEFDCVDATLFRLTDGELPDRPWNHYFPVAALAPDRSPRKLGGLSDEQVEGQLVFLARVLREHGAAFLAGDLGVLSRRGPR